MIIRSLRWRLVVAMALIIAAVATAAGVFSSLTVKKQFERYLTTKKNEDARAAFAIIRSTPDLDEALKRVHGRFGFRTLVLDGAGRVTHRYPPELASFRVRVLQDGGLELIRTSAGGYEALRIRGMSRPVPGAGTVHLLPPSDRAGAPRTFRLSVDRWLVIGMGIAALLALLVVLTFFRRVFRPVEALTAGARALAGGRLETRVDVRGNDEVAELGRAFNGMAEALERNERARRNMVSDVAHELRTPLTSIRVQIEAVQDGVIEADAKFLASIEEDAATLSRLVDDLQQLSLADAGELRLEMADVAVAELVERAMSGVEGVAITSSVDPSLTVRGDARRLVQVIRNLLVNAVAYAESSIVVTACALPDGMEIRVADDGPGVPEEHATRIFDRFYRADPSRSRSTGGAGLGLAIAKQLVELHGGTIRYERPAFVVRLLGSCHLEPQDFATGEKHGGEGPGWMGVG
ncbi:MAG TPA: ATP-binding protein [Thermoanaerobaculia bacterium]|nr:ATP-binding protein [Thermoanaerobaculia bacterium]